MKRARLLRAPLVALVAGAWLAAACGDDPAAPPVQDPCRGCAGAGASTDAGTSGAGGSGGSGGASGSAGTDADAGLGGSGEAGADAGATDSECGNGIREDGEACDGSELGSLTCASFGFLEGELSCSDECAAVTTLCTGTEVCGDGADNDGDGIVDCDDSDCAGACADFCSAPTVLPNGAAVAVRISGQLAPAASSCAPDSPVGQVVFSFDPSLSGVVYLYLEGDTSDLRLSTRTACADVDAEVSCELGRPSSGAPLLVEPVTEGETLYVVVESPDRSVPRSVQLIASAHEIACGDGYVDDDEECDDGNRVDEDGCNNDCVFQTDEDSSNATIGTADAYSPPEFFGEISSVNDVDVISIEVAAGQRLAVETLDLGDGACSRDELDNWIDVLDPEGNVLASNDDYGVGAGTTFCAALVTEPLGAGTHYVRTRASGVAERFLYRLVLTLQD